MKLIWLALLSLALSTSPSMVLAADYIRLSSEEFQTVEIPSWMYGYVAVTFTSRDYEYVALHDFQNPAEPVICLMSSNADSADFQDVLNNVTLHWYRGTTCKPCSHHLVSVEHCQEISWQNQLQRWQYSQIDGIRSEIRAVCAEGMYCAEFRIIDIEIQFPGELPEWAKIHPPFQLYNN